MTGTSSSKSAVISPALTQVRVKVSGIGWLPSCPAVAAQAAARRGEVERRLAEAEGTHGESADELGLELLEAAPLGLGDDDGW